MVEKLFKYTTRGEVMHSVEQQTIESIFYYEMHRKKLISQLRKNYHVRFNDLLFLQFLLDSNLRRIPLFIVKKNLDFSLMEIHKSLTTLFDLKIVGKERSIDDERKVFITLTDEQINKANQLLKEFDQLQQSILKN